MTSRPALGLALAVLPLVAGVAGSLVASGAARAEERDPFVLKQPLPLLRDDVAGTRKIAGYEPAGVRMGALLVHPQVTLRADADSNMLNRAVNQQGDVALRVVPALSATGDAGLLHFALGAEGSVARYLRLHGQDHETYGLDGKVVLPLGGALTLGASGAFARKQEPNYTVGAATIDSGPTLFEHLSGSLGLRAELGPDRIEGKIDFDRTHYLPVRLGSGGGMADQSFRDMRVLTATLRADHALAGGHIAFVQGAYRVADSLHALPCCSRTARGGEVMAGLKGDVDGVISAELAAGYQWRTYRSPLFADYRALAWRARVEWYATPLVSVSVVARRDIVEAGLANTAGVVVDSVGLKVFHEARRNLQFVLSAGYAREQYRDNAAFRPAAKSYSAGIEARYALSSRWLLGAYARYRNRNSDSTLLPRLGHATESGVSLRFQM